MTQRFTFAIESFFSRAREIYSGAVKTPVFFWSAKLIALIFCVAFLVSSPLLAARKPKTKVTPPAPIATARFDNIGAFTRIEIQRTNPRNHAFEKLILTEKEAAVERSVAGFRKSLPVEPTRLASLTEKIRAMGEVKAFKHDMTGQVEIQIRAIGAEGKREMPLDPSDELQPVYVEFMSLRSEVLANGR